MKQKTGFRIGDSLSTVHRSLFTLLTLSLLAAGTAQAQVKITGGITNKYRLNGVNYYTHTFTSSQTITISSDVDVDVLLVAGGGAGGGANGGGGGAGGLLYSNAYHVSSGPYDITVGGGGTGGADVGGQGGNSVFSTLTAWGGGGGGNSSPGQPGGSGGGAGRTTALGGACTNLQGNIGGQCINGDWGNGGGGGGAGTQGGNSSKDWNGGDGGAGLTNVIRSGLPVVYAGGGGGSTDQDGGSHRYIGGKGGIGGGGKGGTKAAGEAGINGLGGGGGGSQGANGANGGSGIVIVRYVNNETYDPTVTVVSATATWGVTNAAFRVFRPSTDPGNLDYTLPFTLSGTATNGTDYASAASINFQNSGALIATVLIPAGQMSAVVNLYPLYNPSLVEKQATLTLDGSTAGSSTNATVTFPALPAAGTWAAAALSSGGGYTTNYTLGSAPNATNYSALVFTNSGTLTVTSGGKVEYLCVGGGGGGGGTENWDSGCGGGGAGGFLTGLVSLVSGSYAVNVGGGGDGARGNQGSEVSPKSGTDSSLGWGAICAFGGGTGANYGPGGPGGSGGGAARPYTGGDCKGGQGNKGGDGIDASCGGGGGGANGPGTVAQGGSDAAGGGGRQSSLKDGVTAVTYAAGGTGHGSNTAKSQGQDAGNYTGNGGGGARYGRGGNGGSGIVIVRVVVLPPPKGTVVMFR